MSAVEKFDLCFAVLLLTHLKNFCQLSAWFENSGNARFQFYIVKIVLLQQMRSAK